MSGSVHIFWVLSRAAGITAMVLAGLSVASGLLVRTKARAVSALEVRPLHETLTLATLAMIALHGLVLLGDPWLNPGIAGIAIPFASPYRPLWTGLGVLGAYGLATLGLAFYARARIGVDRWKRMHRWVAAFWILALVHSLGAGSDARKPWFLALLAVSSGPPLILLVLRIVGRIRVQPKSGEPSLEPSNAALRQV